MELKKTAFMFPGQASQYIGMGRNIYEKYPEEYGHLFDMASQIIGRDSKKLMFEGPLNELTKTEFAQPLILLSSLLSYRLFNKRPVCGAGHSLGEFSALCAAGAISIEDALGLVHKRGRFMQEAVPFGRGKMIAVIGAELSSVKDILKRKGDACDLANINSGNQFVLSGSREGVESCEEELVKENYRVVELKVSAPFHSRLMKPAAEKLKAELKDIHIVSPSFPVYSNVTAEPYKNADEIKELLVKQCYSPVLWFDIILNMKKDGIDTVIEVGPNNVLTGLVKRIDRKLARYNIEDESGINDFFKDQKA